MFKKRRFKKRARSAFKKPKSIYRKRIGRRY